ncbi:hypothetical protein [Amycolatopsis aidingensis]|uniref:hypothetical protein n=1 Tax=Amycolatopsis aidingensis TaxID=2842453 RepID=UPI001C0D081F|nr:hypothetical protein [Amycolatopsis aidingensis]
MLTDGLTPVYREDDELVGYLRPAGAGWQPLTVFGYPLGEPVPAEDAIAELKARGLACLADRWSVYWPSDGCWYSCRIAETGPGWVRVAVHDYGAPDFGATATFEHPGRDRLRPG